MSFTSLSVEIHNKIIGYLDGHYPSKPKSLAPGVDDGTKKFQSSRLSPYATISRLWQDLIERRNFAFLVLDPKRVVEAKFIMTDARFSLVRTVEMKIWTPQALISK